MPQGGSPEGEKFPHMENASRVGTGGNFGTSEGNAATGAWKARQTEFTTGMSANQHFPARNTCLHTSWGKWRLGPGLRLQGFTPGRGLGLTDVKILWGGCCDTAESRGKPALTDHCALTGCRALSLWVRRQRARQTAVCDHRGVHAGRPARQAWVAEVGLAPTAVYDPREGRLAGWPLQKPAWASEVGDESTAAPPQVAAATKLWQGQAAAHTLLGAHAASLSQGTWDREPAALGSARSAADYSSFPQASAAASTARTRQPCLWFPLSPQTSWAREP